jgi:hypothetical protein
MKRSLDEQLFCKHQSPVQKNFLLVKIISEREESTQNTTAGYHLKSAAFASYKIKAAT